MFLFLRTLIYIMSLGGILFFSILFFGSLKYIKKTHLAHWKFPDYVRLGYFENLVNKYINKF
jgi:hypothetical protein